MNDEETSTPTPSSSSTQPSSTFNLSQEYALTHQTNSYNELRSKFDIYDQIDVDPQHLLFLQPNRELVDKILQQATKPNTTTRLLSLYFGHTENAANLCLLLYRILHHARTQYQLLPNLFEMLKYDITESQCRSLHELLVEFDGFDNPFSLPFDSHKFDDLRRDFNHLQAQLDVRIRKSRSRISSCSALWIIRTGYLGQRLKYEEIESDISRLDTAAKGTYVLNNDLDTIERLVRRLHSGIENDRFIVRLGLERERCVIQVKHVLKQVENNHGSVIRLLNDLEEHVCLCFNTVNRARSQLLEEIDL